VETPEAGRALATQVPLPEQTIHGDHTRSDQDGRRASSPIDGARSTDREIELSGPLYLGYKFIRAQRSDGFGQPIGNFC